MRYSSQSPVSRRDDAVQVAVYSATDSQTRNIEPLQTWIAVSLLLFGLLTWFNH
jgi:hypothetical protein